MTTMISLILAIMLSIGGSTAGASGNTGIQAPIDNNLTINRNFEDYSQKTASRLFPKKIPEIVLIDQPKTQTRLIFTLPPKEKLLLMGYEDSMNLYQAFNMNPINFTDPFGKDVLGSCAESYKYYLNPTENEETIEAHKRALALVGEGAANAAVKTFLLPAKYITLPARLLFGFDFDVSLNFTEEGSVVNAGIGQQNRLGIVKAQTVVYPLADFVTQTGYDAYFGLSYQGGNSSLGKSSRENLARSAGALGFNTLFWENIYSRIKAEASIGNAPSPTRPPARPTWQNSETDFFKELKDFGFEEQASFKNGSRVPYGTQGSVRPDLYSSQLKISVDIKNYNLTTPKGRYSLIKSIVQQARSRTGNLPNGARQSVILDIRGQVINPNLLNRLRSRIVQRSGGLITNDDIVILGE
jgi:hypothetical protein